MSTIETHDNVLYSGNGDHNVILEPLCDDLLLLRRCRGSLQVWDQLSNIDTQRV